MPKAQYPCRNGRFQGVKSATVGNSCIMAIDESPGTRAVRLKRREVATGRSDMVSESEASF